jgi:hypothetical protein
VRAVGSEPTHGPKPNAASFSRPSTTNYELLATCYLLLRAYDVGPNTAYLTTFFSKELLDRRVNVHVQRELFPRIHSDNFKRLDPEIKRLCQTHPTRRDVWVRAMRLQDLMGSWPEWMTTRARDHLQLVATYNKVSRECRCSDCRKLSECLRW